MDTRLAVLLMYRLPGTGPCHTYYVTVLVSLYPYVRTTLAFSFENYITNLQEAYSTLTRYQNVVPAQFCVQRMLEGMQVSNTLTIDIAKAHVLENLSGDWLGSDPYKSAKVAI